jgi:ABC-type multidrug transport system permease subunit
MMALRDGAFQQLLELIGYGYVSLFFYLLFKACERVLVARIVG